MLFVLELWRGSCVEEEACSITSFASISEIKKSENTTSYCALISLMEAHMERIAYLWECKNVIVHTKDGLASQDYWSRCQYGCMSGTHLAIGNRMLELKDQHSSKIEEVVKLS